MARLDAAGGDMFGHGLAVIAFDNEETRGGHCASR
jgi:hypothetical protein